VKVPTGRLDFVIAGAQKAGTTHLHHILAAHPAVAIEADEVPYFEDPFYERTAPAAFAAVFAGASPAQRWGIHRPDYLGLEPCATRINAYDPSSRIVVVLRDPVARAVSAYFWYMQFRLLPLVPLNDGMRRLLDGWTDPSAPRAAEILDFGRYGHHVGRYLDIFGTDRVRVLTDDDLDDHQTLRDLLSFLDLDPDALPPLPRSHANAGVYEPHRLRVLRWRSRFAFSWDDVDRYDHRSRRWRRPVAAVPVLATVALDRLVLARVWGNRAPTLDPDVERRLRDFYADDIAQLERVTQRSFDAWVTTSTR
jgi:hypothetical protein